MEARVDIKKLQLLNDRIAQTIDALNQVRLSVHSTQPQFGPIGSAAAALGMQHSSLAGISPFGSYASLSPMAALLAQSSPYGISHSSALGASYSPWAALAAMSPAAAALSPAAAALSPAAALSASLPFSALAQSQVSPWIGGLSHSSLDPSEQWVAQLRANDPRRIAATFPFAFASYGVPF